MNDPKEELFLCIYECMTDSLHSGWKTAYMRATIRGNEIDASFRFDDTDGKEEQAFTPTNIFAPLNAARKLHEIMTNEGTSWNTLIVKIFNDGAYEVFTQ